MTERGIYISKESNRRNNICQLLTEASHELSIGEDVSALIAALLALHRMTELENATETSDAAIQILRAHRGAA